MALACDWGYPCRIIGYKIRPIGQKRLSYVLEKSAANEPQKVLDGLTCCANNVHSRCLMG